MNIQISDFDDRVTFETLESLNPRLKNLYTKGSELDNLNITSVRGFILNE